MDIFAEKTKNSIRFGNFFETKKVFADKILVRENLSVIYMKVNLFKVIKVIENKVIGHCHYTGKY